MKKYQLNWAAVICLGFVACGKGLVTHEQRTVETPKKVVPGKTEDKSSTSRTSQRPRGAQLFQYSQSDAALAQMRVAFLQNTQVVQPTRSVERYNVNTVRGPMYQANSPMVHTYHGVNSLVPVAVSLPQEFRYNIPEAIQDIIRSHDVTIICLKKNTVVIET